MNFFICNRYDKRNEDIYIITPNFPIDKDKIYIYKYNQFKKLNPEKTYVFSKNESKNNKTFQSFEETDELQIIDYPYQNQNRENNINSIFFDKAKMTTSFMENNSGYYYCFKNSNINDNSFKQNEIKTELNKKDKLISLVSNSNVDKKPMGQSIIYRSYMFDNLTELKGENEEFKVNHQERIGFAGNYNMNKWPNYTADSCSDFAMSVIRIQANGRRGEDMSLWEEPDALARRRDVPVYGFNLHNTNSKSMYGAVEDANGKAIGDTRGGEGSWNFENAMINLGYKKIRVTNDMTVEDLKVGDLLISKEHAEFYVGVLYASEYYDNKSDIRNVRKRSGTKTINYLYGPEAPNVAGGKANGTFSWGNVKDEFPTESKDEKYTYFFKKDGEAYFRLCHCGAEPTSTDSYHKILGCDYGTETCRYEVIWRKVR